MSSCATSLFGVHLALQIGGSSCKIICFFSGFGLRVAWGGLGLWGQLGSEVCAKNGADFGPQMVRNLRQKWRGLWTQHGPKIAPKMVRSLDPKWSEVWTQNGAEFGPKMVRNLDPKWRGIWTQNGTKFGPKMVRNLDQTCCNFWMAGLGSDF